MWAFSRLFVSPRSSTECHECNRCNLLIAVDLSPDSCRWIATLYNGTCMGIISNNCITELIILAEKFWRFDWFIALLFPRNSGRTAKIDGITRLPCYTSAAATAKAVTYKLLSLNCFMLFALNCFVLVSQKTVMLVDEFLWKSTMNCRSYTGKVSDIYDSDHKSVALQACLPSKRQRRNIFKSRAPKPKPNLKLLREDAKKRKEFSKAIFEELDRHPLRDSDDANAIEQLISDALNAAAMYVCPPAENEAITKGKTPVPVCSPQLSPVGRG